ncbi:MAG: nucleoside 2-deoxyribosyltransferase, partial [Anaerolineae bacterium]|nr:nucleoside 2-deoxyribosyltransferase [Anaerolineae bacterium]
MNVLTTLIKEQRIAYIFTRLFDYSDKIKAEHLEQVVIKAIERAHLQANLTYDPPSPYTFVPFRDTEQDMIDSPDQIRIIYDADIERLKRAFLLVGFLDGLSKDEGICMEIGYAFGLGTPVLLISTDFIWRAIKNCENTTHVIDPVIDLMVTRLIRKYDIPPQDAPFLDRLLAAQNVVYAQVEEAVYQLLLSDPTQPKWTTDSAAHFDVYLEFGGGLFEWERRLMSQLSDELTCEGFRVAQSARYLPDAALRSAVERGQADLHHALHASVIVVCS